MLDTDGVALAIVLLEVAWTTIAYESTVNHDNDIVTKRLSFVHSMSSKDHRRGVKTLEHLEQTSSGHGVNTSGRLIQELDLWISYQ